MSAYIHTQKMPCWDYIPSPENSKAPHFIVGSFLSGALLQALWFYVTAVTAVTMFYTFSLAVTAVAVVTPREKSS